MLRRTIARSASPRSRPCRARFGRAWAQTADRRLPRQPPPPAPRPGLHVHRQRRPLQRIHFPRHLADRRQACGARRLRLGAFERLLSRHVGIEHQLARGFRPLHRSSLEWDFYGGYKHTFPGSEDWNYDVGTLLLLLPGPPQSRRRQRQHVGGLRRHQLEMAQREGVVQPRRTTSARSRPDRRPTAPGISTSTRTIRLAIPASRCSATYGILNVSHDGSGNSKVALQRLEASALSYAVPDGLFKASKSAPTTAATTAKKAFYTDLTGYNTAKDAGVVYVKKTF